MTESEDLTTAQPAMAMALLRMAIERGVSTEDLERLVALHERAQDRAAEQELNLALREFQGAMDLIPRSATATYVTRTGIQIRYAYAPLEAIAPSVRDPLHERGLSYSWDSEQTASTVTAICTLRHVGGASRSSRFTCPIMGDDARMDAGKRAQAALTVAMRRSLILVLGLSTGEPDTDGTVPDDVRIDASQAADLHALISEVGANEAKFLKVLGVAAVEEIRAADMTRAVAMLREKQRRAGR